MDALKMLLQASHDKATHLTATHKETVEILKAQVNEEAQKNQAFSEDLKLQEQQNVALVADLQELNESNTALREQLECLEAQKKKKKAGWKKFFHSRRKKRSQDRSRRTASSEPPLSLSLPPSLSFLPSPHTNTPWGSTSSLSSAEGKALCPGRQLEQQVQQQLDEVRTGIKGSLRKMKMMIHKHALQQSSS
ncbi:hypothetical protein LDENG_00067920 [Lucifuga dentata]|nr:hypothetical protein LDENG_00067920 [Lucifuga dentata]